MNWLLSLFDNGPDKAKTTGNVRRNSLARSLPPSLDGEESENRLLQFVTENCKRIRLRSTQIP